MAYLLLAGWSAAGQSAAGALDSLAAGQLVRQYQRATQAEAALLQGMEYVNGTAGLFLDHPFFIAALPLQGSLDYQGRHYDNLPLLYDEVQNCVVLVDTAHRVALRLFSEQVAGFTLESHRFIRLPADSTQAADFYEVLADGPARLLATRHKLAVKHGTSGEMQVTDHYFLARAGHLARVSGLRQLLTLLPGQRAALQQLVRSRHLTGRADNREADYKAVVRLYNELVTSQASAPPN